MRNDFFVLAILLVRSDFTNATKSVDFMEKRFKL